MNIACPICKSTESRKSYDVHSDGHAYSVETCSNCSHHFTRFNFEIDPELLYSDEVYQVVDNRDSVYSKIMNQEYGHVLHQVGRLYPTGSRLLDFGSGKGVFLNLAQKAGFQSTGVETAEARADFAESKYGLQIIRSLYRKGPIGNEPYDVITLFHVLEHLPEPKELVDNLLKDNLRADGMLVLEVPNFSSLQSGIAGNKWMHLDIPRHLSHFSQKRLKAFCKELNLEIVKTEYLSWHLGILGMAHSILTLFGYQGKIIKDLKHYNKKLLFALIPVLPLALVLELLASAFNRGGIIRVYCRRAE